MNRKDLFNAINNMDEKYVHEAEDVYNQPQKPSAVRLSENRRQSNWGIVLGTALCTAAACAVFVPIAKSGSVDFLTPASRTESTGASYEGNGMSVPEAQSDPAIEKGDYVSDSIFVYENGSVDGKSFKPGDQLGEGAKLLEGHSYFRKADGDLKLCRQEFTVENTNSRPLQSMNIAHWENSTDVILWSTESLSDYLGLPNFFESEGNGDCIELNVGEVIGETEGPKTNKKISVDKIKITVDYSSKNVTFYADTVNVF